MALFEQLKSSMAGSLSQNDRPILTPLKDIKATLDSLLAPEVAKKQVAIDLGFEGIELKFASAALYTPGSSDISSKSQATIRKVSNAITAIDYYPFKVKIEGHTDDVPIRSRRFPSNWELSVSRATNIVRTMIKDGIDPKRMEASGYAETKPEFPFRDSNGTLIPENRSKNRRVVIYIN